MQLLANPHTYYFFFTNHEESHLYLSTYLVQGGKMLLGKFTSLIRAGAPSSDRNGYGGIKNRVRVGRFISLSETCAGNPAKSITRKGKG